MALLLFGVSLGASSAGADVGDTLAPNASLALVDVEPAVEIVIEAEAAISEEELALEIETEALESQLESSQEQIETLEGELDSVEATLAAASVVGSGDDVSTDQMEQWRVGYSIGGGRNLAAFENTILPCESGGSLEPFLAVGPTDDWGRAQINRPVWKERFELLTGVNFEANITDPTLNGFMAAHIEQEQGLVAWTCWRNR